MAARVSFHLGWSSVWKAKSCSLQMGAARSSWLVWAFQPLENKTGWSTWPSIFCPDWHNDSCTRGTDWENGDWCCWSVLPLLCCLAPWGKVTGKKTALKAASTVPGMESSRLSDPWWPGTAASRRVNTERINSLAKGPVSVGLPSKTSQPEGLYSALTPDATKQKE